MTVHGPTTDRIRRHDLGVSVNWGHPSAVSTSWTGSIVKRSHVRVPIESEFVGDSFAKIANSVCVRGLDLGLSGLP